MVRISPHDCAKGDLPLGVAAPGVKRAQASLAAGAPLRDTAATPMWRLARGHTLHLPAVRAARWLRLREGRLWITADGRFGGPPPEDWWLAAGQSLRLPPSTALLAEACTSASFELLEEAPGA